MIDKSDKIMIKKQGLSIHLQKAACFITSDCRLYPQSNSWMRHMAGKVWAVLCGTASVYTDV